MKAIDIKISGIVQGVGFRPFITKLANSLKEYILLPELIILNVINDLYNNISKEEIALKFHSTIVNYIINMCIKIKNTYLINTVALSGSIFENNFILKNTYKLLKNNNFTVLIPKGIPLNDGSISIGQIAIANSI